MSFSVRKIEHKPKRSFRWQRAAVIGITIARPLLAWYRSYRHRKEEEERTLLLKRVLLVLVAVFCAVLLFAGTAKAILGLQSVGLRTLISMTGGEIPHDANGFTNLLLLGQGGESHDGVDLTDTMMIASIDPTRTHSVVALSLPRDLYILDTQEMGEGRVNSLYRDYKSYLRRTEDWEEAQASQAAMKQLAIEIGTLVGLQMHGVVKVDFEGFVDVVDVLGGIDIEVPEDILDAQYPDENYGYQVFAINKGMQHLDGETALKYARSRHTSSDFDRSARQQQILIALAEKAKAEKLHRDVGAITDIFRILEEHVETTLSIRELISVAGGADKIDRSRVITMQLSDHNGLYGSFAEPGGFLYAPPREQFSGASVLLPVSIPEFPVTWKQIQTLTRVLFQGRAMYLAQPTIAILNAGARSGNARVLGTELIRFGFNVDHIDNAETLPDQDSSWIVESSDPAQKPLVTSFAEMLNLPIKPAPAGSITSTETRTVTIVLGTDYQYQPLQDLLSSTK